MTRKRLTIRKRRSITSYKMQQNLVLIRCNKMPHVLYGLAIGDQQSSTMFPKKLFNVIISQFWEISKPQADRRALWKVPKNTMYSAYIWSCEHPLLVALPHNTFVSNSCIRYIRRSGHCDQNVFLIPFLTPTWSQGRISKSPLCTDCLDLRGRWRSRPLRRLLPNNCEWAAKQ